MKLAVVAILILASQCWAFPVPKERAQTTDENRLLEPGTILLNVSQPEWNFRAPFACRVIGFELMRDGDHAYVISEISRAGKEISFTGHEWYLQVSVSKSGMWFVLRGGK